MLQKFYQYLGSLGLSAKSLKNYRSDINHFSQWLILKVKSLGTSVESFSETIPFLQPQVSSEYKEFLSENKIPVKTVNRRLSTLRHLSRFLFSSKIVDFDFMKGQTNVTEAEVNSAEIVNHFAKFLEKEKVSQSTSKNYLSDVRQLFQSLS